MYIQPQTNIRLLNNVPLDTTYEHTIYFASSTAQYNYFITKQKYNLTNYSYQRVNKGICRVGIPADNIYDCNYMMFQNTAYGNKWFYAFITAIEFVNNETSEITFELDVMQTWFFDYSVDNCFVEREHSTTDNLFENLVPENLELGDYIISYSQVQSMGPMSICALTSKTSDGSAPTGKTINHIYTPLNVIAGISADDAESINTLLQNFVGEGQEDAIITLYQYPSWLGDAETTLPATQTVRLTPNFTSIDGYRPKNKKLFSYPYTMLVVSNNSGDTAEYRWEQFESPEAGCAFDLTGVFISTPCVLAYPVSYRGLAFDYDSGITMSNFPQVPWSGDTFKAWLAQNKGTIATSLLSTVMGAGLTVAGVGTGNPLAIAGGLLSVGDSVGNILGKSVDAKNTPPQVHGQVQCDSLNAGMSRFQFSFYYTNIRSQFARIIDDYFTMFGYATKRVKTPNRNARPHWNYVKTIGCVVSGSVPADDMKKICGIYDAGITFWKNASEIGDYSLDNSPS